LSLSGDVTAVEMRIRSIAGERPNAVVREPSRRSQAPLDGPTFERLVRRASAGTGVDPALVSAVARTESGLDPGATSPAGAIGLMQLMPATAQAFGVADPYDPAANVRAGAAYLRELLGRFGGDVPTAVAAYNAGPGAVERYGGVPPFEETRRYVARVMATFRAERQR
jgi:soluble lytic murein transglycosylase-like protein